MRPEPRSSAGRIFTLLAGVLILKVTASVVANYDRYVPPDFSSDFLRGRELHFLGPYRWAFYTHILSGPVALMLGLILVSERFRAHWPQWHRVLGRVQVAWVVLLVTPSGLWMARYAAAGPVGGLGLAALAIATAACISFGARAAVLRSLAEHRRWMWRCYLLLCSAIVLRLIGGLATVAWVDASWVDPLANWGSWLLPLGLFEWREWTWRRPSARRLDGSQTSAVPERQEMTVP